MKPSKAKEPVRLRSRKLANGNTSLYLDIYQRGRRRYEFLKLYLIPERNAGDRQRNEQTLAFANTIKAQRVIEMQASAHGLAAPTKGARIPFVEFLQGEQESFRARGSESYVKQIGSLISQVEKFGGGRVRLEDVDRSFIEDFIAYLRRSRTSVGKPLRESTQWSYLNNMAAMLSRAVRAGLIVKSPMQDIAAADLPRSHYSQREFLTLQEVQTLAATPCSNESVKRSFLFSCFCGLRLSDIQALRWRDIRNMGDERLQVELIQQKTQEAVYLPLSDNAAAQLPARGAAEEAVFPLPARTSIAYTLTRWTAAAGIDKHVTFHVARHTCATLLLTFGADLYTVSKLLGHSDVKTTQIYAKVVDEKKRQAVDMVPKI